ncbi:MAG TPA: trigger factor [Chloroflexi bacterium]|nr:trigger factor [Chloroflexota bacterium]
MERKQLKIEQNYLEDHQLEVTVEAEQDVFEKAKHLAAKEMSKGKNIPGFRPGKAPYQRVVTHFGEAAIIDHALDHFLDEVYPKIIEEIDREPYGPGQVKEIKTLEPPTFVFYIPLQPEVKLGEYREIRLPFEKAEVADEEVDKILDRMLSQQASIEPVEHPAEEGNLVDTSLDARAAESDPENEESFLLRNQPLPVMIKGKKDDENKEWPFPGFSRQLLGVSSGDALELNYEFPDDETVDEDYRGKEVLYAVQVEGIRERVLPKLDDAFVKTVSDLESVDELREQILEELSAQQEIEDENTYVNSILDKILEDAEVKFPPQMVDNEIEGEVRELESRLKSQGMDLEMYLKIQDLEEEGLREQIKPNAEKRIIRGLVIGNISESEDLDIDTQDITDEFKSILDDHFADDDKGRAEYMQSGDSVALLNRVSSQIITRKTLDFLMAIAQGEDITDFLKKEEPEEEVVEEESKEESSAEIDAENAHDAKEEKSENEDQE